MGDMDRPMYYNTNRMRFELLRALYTHWRSGAEQPFSERELEEEFMVSPMQFDRVVDWVVERGYATDTAAGRSLALTQRGVAEMEARAEHWRTSVDGILDWLAGEKARIAGAAASKREEIRLKMEAVKEARQRRLAVLAEVRDMDRTFAG